MTKSVLAAAVVTLLAIVVMALTAGDADAQSPGGLPFSNIYKRPAVSPYTMLGNTSSANSGMPGGMGGGVNPLLYQQLIQPQLQQQQQQIEQMRQGKQLGGLQNQVQQIQRSTSMRQVDEMIRPTGHASTYQNLSHFYPQR
ncbi:MAG: hypothetical protein WCJ18_03725 [Planctomycetota bacterium]